MGLRLFGKSLVKLEKVFSTTVNKKTGTIIQRAPFSSNSCIGGPSILPSDVPGVTKLITYGKNTKMRQAGIDQVQITTLQNGSKGYQYFHGGKQLYGMGYGPGFASESNQILRGPEPNGFGNFITDSKSPLVIISRLYCSSLTLNNGPP